MPLMLKENKILTKVLGVNTRLINEDPDKKKVRQVVLMEMHERPEMVDNLYLKKSEVWVTLDGNNFHLGNTRPKYEDVINDNITNISHWKVTGGHPIVPLTFTTIAGEKTPIPTKQSRANYGLNICIDLLGKI